MERCLLLTSIMLVGCAADSVASSELEFEPQCGREGPVELLALQDGETVGSVGVLGPTQEVFIQTFRAERGRPSFDQRSVRRVVVDRCGLEVVAPAADVLSMVRTDAGLFGCVIVDEPEFSVNLVYLDDVRDPSPQVVARGTCELLSMPTGVLACDVNAGENVGRLVAIDVRSGEVWVTTIVDDACVRAGLSQGPQPYGDRVVVQASDGRILGVDPISRDVVVEVEAAGQWAVSTGALAYRPLASGAAGALPPLILRDQQTGVEEVLEVDLPISARLLFGSEDLLTVWPAETDGGSSRWFSTRPLREIVPPAGTKILTLRPDGLIWLNTRIDQQGALDLARWREGETLEVAMTCTECALASWGQGASIDVLVGTGLRVNELWRLDDAGGPPREIGGIVGFSDYAGLSGERVLSVLYDRDAYGDLVIYDGSGSPPQMVAQGVPRFATVLTKSYNLGLSGLLDDSETIVYEVDNGDRHALYRARLASP